MPGYETFYDIGYRRTNTGGRLGVWSANATSMSLLIWSEKDPDWLDETVSMARGDHGVWTGSSDLLVPGSLYSIRADGPTGPQHVFDPEIDLLDPYARGIIQSPSGVFRSVVVESEFDWDGVEPPRTPLGETVIYEAHVKGLTITHPDIPEDLRGTYAGLVHPVMIEHLRELGVTAVELLPVHHHLAEDHLRTRELDNYWGYNTLGFFAPQPTFATRAAVEGGRGAVLREFKTMVRELHRAGIEVFLDVVYNHTAEGGYGQPPLSFRGLDNASYYRQTVEGEYIDTTGCGNSLNTSVPAVGRLVLDSLRFWVDECHIDGFRFDLATELGRGAAHEFDPAHPLLRAMLDDPILDEAKLIAEPWDVGIGGWQVGQFAPGFGEWNDGFRDTVREFWLRDIAEERAWGTSPQGVGQLASRLAGSTETYGDNRAPLASINFITSHDGFTLADLVSFDTKHNHANGEDNRDGADHNLSFNFGHEGFTADDAIIVDRRRAMRSLLGTLFVSAGVPMIVAGDEIGRSQHGNNNAYCHDSALTWLDWDLSPWQHDHLDAIRRLITIRRNNPALRSVGRSSASVEISPAGRPRAARTPSDATTMDWYYVDGTLMTLDHWQDSGDRTLQLLVGTPAREGAANRVLVLVHGEESSAEVTLPRRADVTSYMLLWDSSHAAEPEPRTWKPGETLAVGPTSLVIFAVD